MAALEIAVGCAVDLIGSGAVPARRDPGPLGDQVRVIETVRIADA